MQYKVKRNYKKKDDTEVTVFGVLDMGSQAVSVVEDIRDKFLNENDPRIDWDNPDAAEKYVEGSFKLHPHDDRSDGRKVESELARYLTIMVSLDQPVAGGEVEHIQLYRSPAVPRPGDFIWVEEKRKYCVLAVIWSTSSDDERARLRATVDVHLIVEPAEPSRSIPDILS